jgi:putative ABC transport system permease protein
MQQWILAWRFLARRSGFFAIVVAILALGIGTNTALFSVVDAVLLKPLPYPHPDRLVTVMEASPAKNEKVSLIAPGRLADWNRMNRTFDGISGSYSENVTDTSGAEPERLAGRRVAPGYFAVFGVKPVAGRTFTPEEELAGGPLSVVINYNFWTRRYRQSPSAIGRRLILAGNGFTIVGVMPKEFADSAIDLWLPAQFGPGLLRIREARFLSGVGRMKPGVKVTQARADLADVQRELGRQFPQTDKDWSAMVGDLKEYRVGEHRQALLFVFGAVGLLLLLAAANIAGLMLTELERREREFAIRSSIGATRAQVVGAVMREVLLIAAAGVAAGCAIAAWLVDFLKTIPTDVPRLAEIQLDWRALVFAALAGVVAAMLCGLLPALQATRGNLAVLLSQTGRGGSGGRHKWQRALVVGQVALTVLLLASAGLMLRSYHNLSHVDLGFEPGHAITFHVGAAWDEDRDRVGRMQEELLARIEDFPGVIAAGFTNFLPTTGATLRYQVTLEGTEHPGENGKITVGERSISRDYLKALGAPILAGQPCPDLRAMSGGGPKALVNRRFADLYSKGRNMVGQHLLGFEGPNGGLPMEIIGVVGDMREDTLNVTAVPYVYVCIVPGGWPDPEYVARTQGDARALIQAIRPMVRSLDPGRAVFGVKTVQDVVEESLEQPRLNTRMLTLFALAAMALASIGLYGLVTLVVTARTREIGVRMTLGAEPSRIMAQLLAGVARLIAIGIAAGLALTVMANRVLRSVLFGVSPMDTMTLAGAVLALAAVSALATLVPARRAAHIDPLEAIRTE